MPSTTAESGDSTQRLRGWDGVLGPGRRATVRRRERVESVGAARCGAGILPAGPSSVGTAKEETMSLSEGLARLSARAKEAEDRAAAAKTEAREKLELAR